MSLDTAKVDFGTIPTHVGLILDGNGRWANRQGLPRTAGHLAGEKALFDSVEAGLELGIKWMTAFTFSTENWNRSEDEVEFLMWFNEDLLTRRRDDLNEQGVRMWFAGDMEDPRIPERNRKHMAEAEQLTASNDTLNLVFAFNYGSQREIAEATRRLAAAAAEGTLNPQDITEDSISRNLYVPEMPPVDLIIRSSGEHRLSNFLLWQAAYAEFYFPGILWPDFTQQDLVDAVVEYQARERRFGGAEDKVSPDLASD